MRARAGHCLILGLLFSAVLLAADESNAIAFRRVVLSGSQIGLEMDRVRQGVLRQMPIEAFDDLVQRAHASAPLRPRLAKADYSAKLVGDSLQGEANWTIQSDINSPSIISVNPFSPAIRRAAWSDGSRAVFGEFDSRPDRVGVELQVEHLGERDLKIEWSARGVAEPGGLRFDIRLPDCPVTVIGLELPVDLEPVAARDRTAVIGPMPLAEGKTAQWKLLAGALSTIDLSIRPRRNAEGSATRLLVQQKARHDIELGVTKSEYSVDYDCLGQGARRIEVQCSPGFWPLEVLGRNVQSWESKAGATDDSQVVVINLLDPSLSGFLTIRGMSNNRLESDWGSPWIHVVSAVSEVESLTVRVHPEIRLTDWKSGGFRVVNSTVTENRWHVIQAQNGTGKNSKSRPSARLGFSGPLYSVRQDLGWDLSESESKLSAKVTIAVDRGPLQRIPVVVPAGWDLERFDWPGGDAVATARQNPDRSIELELQVPLTTGSTFRCEFRLRKASVIRGDRSESTSIPDLRFPQSRQRTGLVGIRHDPNLEIAVSGMKAQAAMPTDTADSTAKKKSDGLTFPISNLPPEGTVRWRVVNPEFRVSEQTKISVAGSSIQSEYQCRIEPIRGTTKSLVLLSRGEALSFDDWRVTGGANSIRSETKLGDPLKILKAVAQPAFLSSIVELGLPQTFSAVRLDFEKSISGSTVIQANGYSSVVAPPIWLASAAADRKLSVDGIIPVPGVIGANERDSKVALSARTFGCEWIPVALSEIPGAAGSSIECSYRSETPGSYFGFRREGKTNLGLVESADLQSHVADTGRIHHQLTLQLNDWSSPRAEIGLPAGSELQDIRVAGKPMSSSRADSSGMVSFPIPIEPKSVPVELGFSTAAHPTFFGYRCQSPSIRMPDKSPGPNAQWHLEGESRALWLPGYSQGIWTISPFSRAVLWALLIGVAWLACYRLAKKFPQWSLRKGSVTFLVFCCFLSLQAAGPSLPVVFLIPESPGSFQAKFALVPADLLEKLSTRANRPLLPKTIALIESHYEVSLSGTTANVSAQLTFECTDDGNHVASIPSAGCLLKHAKIDEKEAFPRAVGDRWQFGATGRGQHRLELAFSTPCPSGDIRDIRFPILESPICSLVARLPSSARFIQALGRRGMQTVQEFQGAQQLEADLGRAAFLHLRFSLERANTPSPTVSVREGLLWDFRQAVPRLQAVNQYSISGSVASLAIDVPSELDVAAMSARRLEFAQGAEEAWLKSWKMASLDGRRQLQMEFSAPITGNWLVTIDYAMTKPPSESWALPFPRPIATTRQGSAAVAWRSKEPLPTIARAQGFVGISTDEFIREYWSPARLDVNREQVVRAFRRVAGVAQSLIRLSQAAEDLPVADIDSDWTISTGRAVNRWQVKFDSGACPPFVELNVPRELTNYDVAGEAVQFWSQTDNRIQIWLDTAIADASFALFGVVEIPKDATRFEVPVIRAMSQDCRDSLRVAMAEGVSLRLLPSGKNDPKPEVVAGQMTWRFRSSLAIPKIVFEIKSSPK